MKKVDVRAGESVFRWFRHIEEERIEFEVKVYEGECITGRSLGRPRERWVGSVSE